MTTIPLDSPPTAPHPSKSSPISHRSRALNHGPLLVHHSINSLLLSLLLEMNEVCYFQSCRRVLYRNVPSLEMRFSFEAVTRLSVLELELVALEQEMDLDNKYTWFADCVVL